MAWWKDGLLIAAGGVAGLALAAWLDSDEKSDHWDYDEEVERARVKALKSDGMRILVEKVKTEAQWALEDCATDEERQEVYAEVEASIRKLQATLQKRGEKILADLKAQATEGHENEATEGSVDEGTVRHFKNSMDDLTKSLDETLDSLKKTNPEPAV